MASLGIATGVAALIVVLGVMNGFQMGYMNAILEVSSFHVRIVDSRDHEQEDIRPLLLSLPGVRSVLRFEEGRALLSTDSGRVAPIKIMFLPPDFAENDPGFAHELRIDRSVFGHGPDLVVGSEAARQLSIRPGEAVSLVFSISSQDEGLGVRREEIRLKDTFASGYYQFDSALALLPEKFTAGIGLAGGKRVYGIKLADPFADTVFLSSLSRLTEIDDGGRFRVESWREYNRAFFGALRTEKALMLILVGLIFIVVGVNIFHSMRRIVAMRGEDIGVLRALGAGSGSIRAIFTLNGFMTGLRGVAIGMVLGLFIAVNINELLGLGAETGARLSNLVRDILPSTVDPLPGQSLFYIQEVPVRILLPETVLIAAVAIASAALAALSASNETSRRDPAELLRRE